MSGGRPPAPSTRRVDAPGARLPALHPRAEDRDGPHRARPLRLRHRPHDREPPGVRGRGGPQRLRRVPEAVRPRRGALGRAGPAAPPPAPPRPAGLAADPPGPARAPPPPPLLPRGRAGGMGPRGRPRRGAHRGPGARRDAASMELRSKVPGGPIEKKWDTHRFEMRLVNPANKRKYDLVVVGSGLAGASASATLAELGYNVKCFCYQDSPRRAHSIAAQGGINAAKNYQNDGDSVYRLFYDTVKGGDFRAREANVYRLAQISVEIIDQCVAQGVPFAREYGGTLSNRSFGGAQVSRTFYARGQTGQQLLLAAYQAMERQIAAGQVELFPRHEMLDLVLVDGRARGIVTR